SLRLARRGHARALGGADVHEHILRSVVRVNEAITFDRVEELDGTDGHDGSPLTNVPRASRRAAHNNQSILGNFVDRTPQGGSEEMPRPRLPRLSAPDAGRNQWLSPRLAQGLPGAPL